MDSFAQDGGLIYVGMDTSKDRIAVAVLWPGVEKPTTDVIANDWVVAEGVPAQGTLTLHQALVQSCNTVFYQLGYELDNTDPELLPDMAKAFGLGAPTGIPYLPETAGVVPSPEWKLETVGDFWATGDAINLAIGQGYFLATPLQMANVYATIANGGDLLQPFIVEYAQDAAGQMIYDYENWNWEEPPVARFEPALAMPAGAGFRFTCRWDNQSGDTVRFGESADDEMCFFWSYYYPSQGHKVCVHSDQYDDGAGEPGTDICCPGHPFCALIDDFLNM